jgi:hypothetical protein
MIDPMVRFVVGGAVVSVFGVLGDLLKPASFGGMFAAAPTVALATRVLTVHKHAAGYTTVEGRSMLAGPIAFFIYASAVSLCRSDIEPRPCRLLPGCGWFGLELRQGCGLCGRGANRCESGLKQHPSVTD